MKKIAICFLVIYSCFLWANEASDTFYKNLSSVSDFRKKDLLKEFQLFKVEARRDLTELFLIDEPKNYFHRVLLLNIPLGDILKLGWLDNFNRVQAEDRITFWRRLVRENDTNNIEPFLKKSLIFVKDINDSETKVILDLHSFYDSDLLLDKIEIDKNISNYSTLRYYLQFKKIELKLLKYVVSDSIRMKSLKLSAIIAEDKGSTYLNEYENSTDDHVRALALKGRGSVFVEKFLKDKSLLVRKEALREYLKDKEFDLKYLLALFEQAEGYELRLIYEHLLERPHLLSVELLESMWLVSDRFKASMLAEIFSNHISLDYFELIKSLLEKQVHPYYLVSLLKEIKNKKDSEWLLNLLLKSNWSDDTIAKALEVLYQWQEALGKKEYIEYYLNKGYKSGKDGGGYLLKLIGMTQLSSGYKIIKSNFPSNDKAAYPEAAIEAAGWSAGKIFLRPLTEYSKGVSDKVLDWAIKRCKGQSPDFPIEDSNRINRELLPFSYRKL